MYTDGTELGSVEGPKTPAPPLQPIPQGAWQWLRVRFEAYLNTINLIRAIFEFPFWSKDMGLWRAGPNHPLLSRMVKKIFLNFFDFLYCIG